MGLIISLHFCSVINFHAHLLKTHEIILFYMHLSQNQKCCDLRALSGFFVWKILLAGQFLLFLTLPYFYVQFSSLTLLLPISNLLPPSIDCFNFPHFLNQISLLIWLCSLGLLRHKYKSKTDKSVALGDVQPFPFSLFFSVLPNTTVELKENFLFVLWLPSLVVCSASSTWSHYQLWLANFTRKLVQITSVESRPKYKTDVFENGIIGMQYFWICMTI